MYLNRLRERGGEHQRLTVVDIRAIIHNDVKLLLETHIKHAVGLVDAEESHALQGALAALNHIDQATGGGNEHVDTARELIGLRAEIGTTCRK